MHEPIVVPDDKVSLASAEPVDDGFAAWPLPILISLPLALR